MRQGKWCDHIEDIFDDLAREKYDNHLEPSEYGPLMEYIHAKQVETCSDLRDCGTIRQQLIKYELSKMEGDNED